MAVFKFVPYRKIQIYTIEIHAFYSDINRLQYIVSAVNAAVYSRRLRKLTVYNRFDINALVYIEMLLNIN